MHLRRLSLQGIGPFGGRHTIDLEELGASGLFLLEGPTGAGKSTLIDAIVFALYGKVASDEASDDRLRSAHAAPDADSVVDLVFEVPSGVFRIRRTPQYERPKRRGEGTTTQQASAKLWRLPADVPSAATEDQLDALGTPLANRLDEVGLQVQRALGLDRTQFVQTVVLPQGEFARFLRAKPEDRRGLLQKIFGTQVYERLADRLVAMRREADRAVEAARGELAEAVALLAGAARLDEDEAGALREDVTAAVPVAEAAVGAAVRARTVALEAEADRAAAEQLAADAEWERARSAAEETRATAELLSRRERLRAERSVLEGLAEQHAGDVARLDAARRAAPVRPLLAGDEVARAALEAAEKEWAAALDAAPTGLVPVGSAPVGSLLPGAVGGPAVGAADGGDASGAERSLVRHLRDSQRQAVEEAARLQRLVEVEEGLDARRRAVRRAAELLEDLSGEIAADDAWLALRPEQRTALASALGAARTAEARRGELEAAHDAASSVHDAVVALGAAQAELDRVEGERAELGVSARALNDAAATLRAARIADLAGSLAADLHDGAPCPVCGSADHPAPASPASGQYVSAEDVLAAEDACRQVERRLEAVAGRAGELRGTVTALVARTAGRDLAAAQSAVTQARAALDACEAAAIEAVRLDEELVRFDDETALRQRRRQDAAERRATAEAALLADRAALDAAEVEVVEARGDQPTVAARHSASRERADAARQLLDALEVRAGAVRTALVRADELRAGLADASFADAADARAALLDDAELHLLDGRVTTHRTDVARVAAALADPQLARLPDDQVVDVAAAAAAEAAARQRVDTAGAVARLAADRLAAATTAGQVVVARAAALLARIAQAAPAARLATLASGAGDNAHKLSLQTFVLMSRFEDVVAAANERLRVMSDGRYELVRSDEREDVRARTTGLAMRVIDHLTEQPRDPRTLSGGETFYVSLCLALGMADVVTAEAGGIDLGTLFVDEGFGSLDPHVLDQVLAELGRLRAGGRVVGVVSHVEALKQSIADRIEVRPLPDGSSTLTVRAG